MRAALFGWVSMCRSTQLYEAFSSPPTNHFQNGALDVSSTVSHFLYQVSKSAYAVNESGNLSSVNCSRIAGSDALACATNFAGGGEYPSSRQCTAMSASDDSDVSA